MADDASETASESAFSAPRSSHDASGYAVAHGTHGQDDYHHRPISPPSLKRKRSFEDGSTNHHSDSAARAGRTLIVPSPIQLTRIKDLPDEYNVDAVTLHDLIGDALITECWQFNFLYNVDFLM